MQISDHEANLLTAIELAQQRGFNNTHQALFNLLKSLHNADQNEGQRENA